VVVVVVVVVVVAVVEVVVVFAQPLKNYNIFRTPKL
jgi:hypothetical protein